MVKLLGRRGSLFRPAVAADDVKVRTCCPETSCRWTSGGRCDRRESRWRHVRAHDTDLSGRWWRPVWTSTAAHGSRHDVVTDRKLISSRRDVLESSDHRGRTWVSVVSTCFDVATLAGGLERTWNCGNSTLPACARSPALTETLEVGGLHRCHQRRSTAPSWRTATTLRGDLAIPLRGYVPASSGDERRAGWKARAPGSRCDRAGQTCVRCRAQISRCGERRHWCWTRRRLTTGGASRFGRPCRQVEGVVSRSTIRAADHNAAT
jgi:hypothetical protein